MSESGQVLNETEVAEGLAGLDGWSGDTTSITRLVEAASFPAAIELVRKVADVAEEMNHHPDIDIRWRRVRFTLSTHDAGGVTRLDLDQASRINALAG
ncbi:MAG: 4a-hydroxytetrahydrobiopterin dehydratase [Acidimicrobiaceae bacterium]|nr:4a-hydroxytetrahydrobiopterin dehydratase [Acidimicrobiaceae bacterium]MBO0747100.1 4a-hydroxytetrahydrobiopterin dehydratase [Acidimicrobiaceae bacterium]